jgi:pterin-4a-carbinolamine dehydratase
MMTEALANKSCTPCRGGVPPLTREHAEILLAQTPDWQLPEEAHHIERSFRFRNFREAPEMKKGNEAGCMKHMNEAHKAMGL